MIESESIPMFWALVYCSFYLVTVPCFLEIDSLWLVVKTHLNSTCTQECIKSLVSSLYMRAEFGDLCQLAWIKIIWKCYLQESY